MPTRLTAISLLSLSACSLDYLELYTDEAPGTGGGGGAPGCPCGATSPNVLYDENFNAPGWCNPDLAIRAHVEENGRLDPDHPDEDCQALAVACLDPAADCAAYAGDTFMPAAGPIYVHLRIKFNGPWALDAFSHIYLFDVGQAPAPATVFDVILKAYATANGFHLMVCSYTDCGAEEYILRSDRDWHTIVIYNPHDGVETLRYRLDGGSIKEAPGATWTPDMTFTHVNIGWDQSSLGDGPDLLFDDIRICNENGAAECGWE